MRFLLRSLNYLPSGFRKRLFVGIGLASRAMTLGVRVLVRDDQGRILLVRHTYVPGWYLPGGGVERGETIQQAVRKELREECAIEALEEPKLFGVYRNSRTSRYDHVALFICSQWQQLETKVADHEIAELGFFDYDNLPEGTTVPTRNRLAEMIKNQSISEIW